MTGHAVVLALGLAVWIGGSLLWGSRFSERGRERREREAKERADARRRCRERVEEEET